MSERDDKSRFRPQGPQSGPPKSRGFGGRPGGKFAGKPAGRPFRREREDPDGPAILYGWHTVTAALANPRRVIRRLLLTENAARRLSDENIDTRVPPELVRPSA